MNDDLKHYGIPGMRWGRRKGASKSTKERVPGHEDFEKVRDIRKKKTRELSNEELKTLNNRLQLEKQYKDLTKQEKSAGRKFAEDILKEVGKDLVKNALKSTIKSAFSK